jgi:hypothetical protein
VLGTSTYTQPEDTSGLFKINALAEGNYHLRILTTERGYGLFDTTIQVVAGKKSTFKDPVELSRTGVPAVGPITVKMNVPMQLVTLVWPSIDTGMENSL